MTSAVEGKEPFRHVVARLDAAQKSNRGAGGYSRWVNRPLGRRLAALAYLRGLRPNAVSCLSATATYSAIVLVATIRPSWPLSTAVAALLVLGYALDSADGQVARLTGLGSPSGEWLDHVLDAVKVSTFHMAIAICWYRFYNFGSRSWLLVPLGYSAVISVFFFAMTLSDMLRRLARVESGGTSATTSSVDPHESAPVLRSLVVLLNDYGILCIVMILIPQETLFTVVYTALFGANVLYLLAGCVRWFKELSTAAAR